MKRDGKRPLKNVAFAQLISANVQPATVRHKSLCTQQQIDFTIRYGMMSCANAITPPRTRTLCLSAHTPPQLVESGLDEYDRQMRHSAVDVGGGEVVGTLGKCCSPDQIDFLASRRVVCLTFLRPFHSVRLLRLLTLYGFIAHLTEWENGWGYRG